MLNVIQWIGVYLWWLLLLLLPSYLYTISKYIIICCFSWFSFYSLWNETRQKHQNVFGLLLTVLRLMKNVKRSIKNRLNAHKTIWLIWNQKFKWNKNTQHINETETTTTKIDLVALFSINFIAFISRLTHEEKRKTKIYVEIKKISIWSRYLFYSTVIRDKIIFDEK